MVPTPGSDADLSEQSFERILIVKPSSLGDIVHALPVLHGLRTRYPGAKISWLVATPFAPLLEGHAELDELVLFDRTRYGRIGRSPRATGEFIRFLKSLRAARYDLVVDLQGLFRTGFFSWVTGATVRIGFRAAREGGWLFYTHRIHGGDPDRHAVDRNYDLARLLGFDDVPIRFNLSLTDSLRTEAASLLQEAGIGDADRVIAVVPGARWETKVWFPERFAETIDALQSEPGVRCLLLGGPDEAGVCRGIADACKTSPINLAGRTSVRQLAPLVGLADVVLCHDSAPMHLAVALEQPLVCLTGPTNPDRTGPYGRPDDVVRVDLACSPCYLRRLSQCRFGHRCMKELTTASVVAAVRRALDRCAGTVS